MESGSNYSNYKPTLKSQHFKKKNSFSKNKIEHTTNDYKSSNKPFRRDNTQNNDKSTEGGSSSSSLLDVQSTQYYQRVLGMLSKDFEADDEKEVFITNIVNELKANVFKVSQTKIGGSLLEKLLPYIHINDFCDLLEGLSKDWEVVCSSKSASFVVQAFVKLSRHHLLDEAINTTKDNPLNPDLFKGHQYRLLTLLTSNLGPFLTSNLAYHMQHACVSHVLRGLLELLSGRKLQDAVIFGRRENSNKDPQKSKMDGLYRKEVRKRYRKKMAEYLLEVAAMVTALPKLEDHALNTFSGPVIQVLIECLAGVDNDESRDVMEKLIKSLKVFVDDEDEEEEDDDGDGNSTETKKSKLSPLLLHPSGSRMVEPILKHVADTTFQGILDKYFKGHLLTLATHHLGNFVLQTLVQAVRTPEQLQDIYSELRDHLESLLALNHTPLLIKLLTASVKLLSCQQLLVEDLLKCFHCSDKRDVFVRLLLMLVTYEMLYGEETDEKEENIKQEPKASTTPIPTTTMVKDETALEDTGVHKAGPGSLLKHITVQGSMMVQQLLWMEDPSLVLKSLRGLEKGEVEKLVMDASGCRVIEALMQSASVGVEEKRWYVKMFKGRYLKLACSKFGSRTFDAIWEFADEKRKSMIRNELKLQIENLRSDKFGYFVFLKCGFNERKRKKEANAKNSNNNHNSKKKKK